MRKELLTGRDDIFVVHDFLTPAECDAFVARSEAAGYDEAPITSSAGFVLRKDIRSNDRVIIDDLGLADAWWERAKPFFPERMQFWSPVGLNERFRFYRYGPGQQFDWHMDGAFERSPSERSAFTFMVYLSGGCEGGATEFNLKSRGSIQASDPTLRVIPEAGKAVVFVHRVLHRGAPVVRGTKYVLRTDVMCRWAAG